VLIAGGAGQLGHNALCGHPNLFYWVTSSVESFNPSTRQFTLESEDFLAVARFEHTATRLLTGDVLVTGGRTLVRKFCYYGGRYPVPYEVPTTTSSAELIQ
jgi:hypothetical protein